MKRVVVKLGGHVLDSLSPDAGVLVELAQDIARLQSQGVHVVLVHGGGPQIAQLLSRVGVESKFHDGLRITDDETMQYVAMALGHVNLLIVAALNHAGLKCVGLSGADTGLLLSSPLGEPWLRAGAAPQVAPDLITSLWTIGDCPVVSSLALDSEGALLNCNADTAAGALAGALDADALVLLSDIDQLRSDPDDPSSALGEVKVGDATALIASGAARDGMRPKMQAALDALKAGANRVILANGTRAHALCCALDSSVPTTEVIR